MNNMPLFSLENPCACSCHKCKYLHTSPRLQLNMYKMTKACNHKLHNRQARACTAASGSGPPVFIDDGSADRSSRTNCKVYRAILSAHIQRNATKLIRLSFTVQRQRRDILHWPSQSFYLQIAHVFELPKTKLNAERHSNKQ